MAKKSEGPGIQASAGLIRYFDAEEKSSVKIPPVAVLIATGLLGVLVIVLRVLHHNRVIF